MRRIFLLLGLSAACLHFGVKADDRLAEATARAQREEAEERYKLLNGKLESLIETQELLLRNHEKLQQRISALTSELDDVKRSQTRVAVNYATQDQVKALVEKLQEIDDKRIADNEHVLKVLKELQKIPVAPPSPVSDKGSSTALKESQEFWDYTVKVNDTLKKIVIGYNKELAKDGYSPLTLSQVLKANPGLDQDKLYVGKKILIPIPAKKGERTGRGNGSQR